MFGIRSLIFKDGTIVADLCVLYGLVVILHGVYYAITGTPWFTPFDANANPGRTLILGLIHVAGIAAFAITLITHIDDY